jgi:hypothetical protein
MDILVILEVVEAYILQYLLIKSPAGVQFRQMNSVIILIQQTSVVFIL